MALVIADRVRETTTTTGTGAVTLAGAYTSFQSFLAAVGNGNSTYYTIASAVTGEWEVGIGTYTSASNTLSRTTVLASSNAGSLVNFSSGAKDVFVTQPAERSILVQSAGSGLFSGVAAFTANGVPYANSTSTLTTGSALTFDGTTLANSTSGTPFSLNRTGAGTALIELKQSGTIGGYLGTSGSNDFIIFNGSAAELARFNNTGLGIGTSSPTQSLDVNGNAILRLASATTNRTLGFTTSSGVDGWTIGNGVIAAANQFVIYSNTAGAARMLIDSSGNLGIGTSSPWSQLTVGSGGTANPASTVSFHKSTSSEYRLKLTSATFNADGAWLGLGFGYSDNYMKAAIIAEAKDGNARANLHFALNDATSSANASLSDSKMVLTYTGNLGLGVTPSAWTVFKAMQLGSTMAIGGVNGSSSNVFANTYYDGAYKYIGTGAAYRYEQNIATGYHAWYNAASGTAGNAIAFTQAMTLDSSGNLGIGTSSPDSKLHVVSGASSTLAQLRIGYNGTSVNYYDANTHYFRDGSGPTNRMVLDSSGNLGIGTSSPASQLDVSRSGDATISLTSAGVQRYQLIARSGGNFEIYDQSSAASRVTLSQAGNLGLGVTPSAWTTYTAQQIRNASVYGWSGGNSFAALAANTWYGGSPAGYRYISTDFATEYYQYQGAHVWRTAASGTAGDAITFTQAMTLDASGNLLVGKTATGVGTAGFAAKDYIEVTRDGNPVAYFTRLNSDGDVVQFRRSSGAAVGSISVTTTATAYNTSSDYRLKDNQQPLTGSGAFIDALQPKTWNWKADGSRGVGFIAHEVQEVSPGSVVGEKDGERMQAMEYGSAEFIANIIAELQSLRARVAQLESK